MRKVYLDNGSTSFPKAPGVGEAMSDFITEVGCNVGRGGYETAYDLGEKVFETRSQLCRMFHFNSEKNTVFTPSVTYSLNFIIGGLLKEGDHVILSSMDHNAVARPCEAAKQRNVEVSAAPCDREGRLDMAAFQELFRENTALVVMSHGSNVCGTLQDAEEIGKICEARSVPFVLDAAQTAGVVPVDFQKFCLSGLCVTGHKGLLGPQGIGAMLINDALAERLTPVISGGTGSASHLLAMPEFMPDKFEAGTLNLPGIIGLNRALQFIEETGIEKIYAHEQEMTELFIENVKGIPGTRLIGLPGAAGRVGTVSLDFETVDNAEMAYLLDAEYGIMTRCGLHCAPLAHQTLGTYPHGTVRFAFGYWTKEEDIIYAVESIREILNRKEG